jgi:hypothetical protein
MNSSRIWVSALSRARKIATFCPSPALAAFVSFRQNTAWLRRPSMTPTAATSTTLFTIGHSNCDLGDFIAILSTYGIQVVGDVRSRPGSFRFPQFNREPLEAGLASVNIQYEFLGESLGGRPSDPRVYLENGLVDYAARRKSPDFSAGVDRVLEISRSRRAVLMCAEEDPLQCHRFLMICPALLERGTAPLHLRKGGAFESQREAEDRLLALHDLTAFDSSSLFASERSQALEDAISRQSREYAFRTSPEAIEYF